MDMNYLNAIVAIVNTGVLVATAIILIRQLNLQKKALKENMAFERQKQTVEATMECNRRFDMICNPEYQDKDAERFFSRFWSQQKHQFDYFTKGFISEQDFLYWMLSRRKDLIYGETYGTSMTVREGWKSIKKQWYPDDFISFFETNIYIEEGEVDLKIEETPKAIKENKDRILKAIKAELAKHQNSFSNLRTD